MWVQKERLGKEIRWDEVLDWVVVDGVMWIEIQDKEVRQVCTARC